MMLVYISAAMAGFIVGAAATLSALSRQRWRASLRRGATAAAELG